MEDNMDDIRRQLEDIIYIYDEENEGWYAIAHDENVFTWDELPHEVREEFLEIWSDKE